MPNEPRSERADAFESARLEAIVARLESHLGPAPSAAIVAGSGLAPLLERLGDGRSISYADLGLPSGTVPGHPGVATVGRLGAARVAVLAGRAHLYEGFSPRQVVRAVRAMHRWGVERMIFTCSAGGIAPQCVPGAIVVIEDHINLLGQTPLLGPRRRHGDFPDMGQAYHPAITGALFAAGRARDVELSGGVYLATLGPAYETPAEVRAFARLGADVVGMSTVPEVLACAELGMPAGALAVVTNRAAGLASGALEHHDVTGVASRTAPRLADVLEHACAALGS